MEQWTNGRPDGMARSSGRLTGNRRFSDLQAESSDITLNSGILDKTTSLHTSDFVQTQNEANNTNKFHGFAIRSSLGVWF
jgi:hypothetical protein